MNDSPSNRVMQRPVMLCILDGWGVRDAPENNAIALSETPNWDRYIREMPAANLRSCALDVGLPDGQMGNSEVGHMNLGAGRIVMQDLPRIDAALADGSLASNPVLFQHINRLRASGGTCHLLGLLSPGGVHSHQNHIVALTKAVAKHDIPVCIHAFLDGRDTPPKSAQKFVANFLDEIIEASNTRIGTVSGRYYAMDRDNRWDRIKLAYEALVHAKGERAEDALSAIDASYSAGLSDEFLLPTVISDYEGIADGDGLLIANFRADRAREILMALIDPAFNGFPREMIKRFAARTGMIEYSEELNKSLDVLFEPLPLRGILGEVVAKAGFRQLRIAETEKYAHVTFFLNGGRETEFVGEDRILVPSPDVATYDLQPEMAAPEITEQLVQAIGSGIYDLIIVNYANGDMVGHTGDLEAAKIAAQTIDKSLNRLELAICKAGGVLVVTADHGNCEEMFNEVSGEPFTQHTLNDVPVVIINAPIDVTGLADGRLCDVAPTLLDLMGLDKPKEMTGKSLLQGNEESSDKHPVICQ